jgi:predicted porin
LDAAVVSAAHQGVAGPDSATNINVADPITIASTLANSTMQGTWSGLVNGGIDGSRWGIKGSETIEPGLKAIFTLESCLNITSGITCNNAQTLVNSTAGAATNIKASSLDGQLFNRQAWVGLESDDMGQIRFGRVNSLGSDVFGAMGYAPVKNSQQFSPLGFSATMGGSGGLTEKARLDNAVSYKIKSGMFNFGANYGFGNIAGSSSAGSTTNLNVGYDDGKLGVQVVYNYMQDAGAGAALSGTSLIGTLGEIGPSVTSGVNVTYENVSSYLFAVKYKLNETVTFKAGLQQFSFSAPSDNLLSGGSCPSYFSVSSAVTECVNLSSAKGGNQHLWHVGVDYQFSDKLYFGLAAANRTYDKNNGGTTDSKNIAFYSLLADYSLTKRTDIYAGAMFVQPGGNGYASAGTTTNGGANNNSVVGFGMRTKF